jgi:hypothetical protein
MAPTAEALASLDKLRRVHADARAILSRDSS